MVVIVDKKCTDCDNLMVQVTSSRKFCDECRKKKAKKAGKAYDTKKNKEISKQKEERMIVNFAEVVKDAEHLVPLGFNKVSPISFNSYINFYRIPWHEIMKKYNKYEEMFEYIASEYSDYMDRTGLKNIRYFCDDHELITTSLIKSIGYDVLREAVGVVKNKVRTEEDYQLEFDRLINKFGRIPLYQEFLEESEIRINVITRYLKRKKCTII